MRTLLSKIGVDKSDVEYILRADEACGDAIDKISKAYFAKKIEMKDALEQVATYATEDFHKYVLNLLFWLHTVPMMAVEYEKRGLPEDLLYETMSDLSTKMRECRELRGCTGIEETWYFLFTDIKLFSMGRLQFKKDEFLHTHYSNHGITIQKGDRVYACHIPSSGKLSRELYLDSFQRAYEFYKPELNGTVIPIVCASYLFYPPYMEKVFPEKSNIRRFANEFDLLLTRKYQTFGDCWRIFNRRFEGTTKGLPTDNELRRNFVKYIDEGGDFGYGYGILLYDGEKKEVLPGLKDEV